MTNKPNSNTEEKLGPVTYEIVDRYPGVLFVLKGDFDFCKTLLNAKDMEIGILKSALEAIRKHQELVMKGETFMSTTWQIANKTLNDLQELHKHSTQNSQEK